ncbi:MAG: YfhO family protein [Clostridia bacterium]|nr:YfhO family protein [Clostridia bacterium]
MTALSLQKTKEKYGLVFGLALATAFAFFLPYLIADQGYFLFFGDFNVQQVPFYQRAHELVREGAMWDYGTDLGVNFIGSYTFYLLGSPFFWLTLPFPNWMVPYLMGPLLILKFGCAALTAYCYITRFVKNKNYAVLGALMYAFSGFSVYNIFFNHFHEAIILFPLLLLSMEQLMTDNRRGFFLLMVALCAVSNYFFFFGMVVFCVIYWMIRMVSGQWPTKFSAFLWLALEAVLGLCLAAFILMPTFVTVLSNSRLDSTINGWGALLYGKEQIYAYIFQSMFFPPELPARPVFFTGADVKWSSVSAWLPLFSMTGVLGWMIAKRKTWQRRILAIMFVMAMIPVLNSAFYMFNYAYYARWFYMPLLIMALVSAQGLEDPEVDYMQGLRWSTGITLAIALAIGFFPTGSDSDVFSEKYGLFDKGYTNRFWIYVVIVVACSLLMWMLLKVKKLNAERFYRCAVTLVCVVSVLYSAVFLGFGKSHSYDTTNFIIPDLLQGKIDVADKDEVRWDVYDGMDNTAMFLDVSSIQAFHSLVPASVTEFYEYVGVDRGVASRPETSNYALRSLLSVKYLLQHNSSNSFGTGSNTQMPYYALFDTQNNFKIYLNECYIPYGFTYDYYVSRQDCDAQSTQNRQLMMLKAMVLDYEQIARYGHLFNCSISNKNTVNDPSYTPEETPTDPDASSSEQTQDAVTDTSSDAPSLDSTYVPDPFEDMTTSEENYIPFTKDAYKKDCDERKATAAYKTVFENNSFTSQIRLNKENLVFYSIPYEEGWSATVDGVPAQIEKVNVGFMAVCVPAGDHTVTFTYRTPQLTEGLLISGGALLLTAVYLLAVFLYRRKHPAAVLAEAAVQSDAHTASQEEAIICADAMQALGMLPETAIEPEDPTQAEPPAEE